MNELTPEQIEKIVTEMVFEKKLGGKMLHRELIKAGAKAQTELLAGVTDEEMVLTPEEESTISDKVCINHHIRWGEFEKFSPIQLEEFIIEIYLEISKAQLAKSSAVHNARLKQARKDVISKIQPYAHLQCDASGTTPIDIPTVLWQALQKEG